MNVVWEEGRFSVLYRLVQFKNSLKHETQRQAGRQASTHSSRTTTLSIFIQLFPIVDRRNSHFLTVVVLHAACNDDNNDDNRVWRPNGDDDDDDDNDCKVCGWKWISSFMLIMCFCVFVYIEIGATSIIHVRLLTIKFYYKLWPVLGFYVILLLFRFLLPKAKWNQITAAQLSKSTLLYRFYFL